MKIALCVSGETRTYSDTNNSILKLAEFFRKHGHEVDIYGYHWDHCEYPDTTGFKKVETGSQDDIRDWVREDMFTRVNITYRNQTYDEPNYFSLLKENKHLSTEEFYDLLVEHSVPAYAQSVGGWRCFKLTENEDYDFYFRLRWDSTFLISHHHDSYLDDECLDNAELFYNLKILEDSSDAPDIKPLPHVFFTWAKIMYYPSGGIYVLINDCFFVLNRSAIDVMLREDILTSYNKAFAKTPVVGRPTEHGLWVLYWQILEYIELPGLQDIFSLQRPVDYNGPF